MVERFQRFSFHLFSKLLTKVQSDVKENYLKSSEFSPLYVRALKKYLKALLDLK